MQAQPVVGDVRVLVDVVEPLGVERARAADDAVDLVALGEQQLGQVRAVLAGDAGDERALHRLRSPSDVLRSTRRSRRCRRSNEVRGLEAEALARARDVEAPARLAVRLAGVPDEAARRSRSARAISVGQVADRDLVAAAEVHRVARVVALGGEHDPLGGVLDVEELARRRAVAPQHDLGVAALARARRTCGSSPGSRATCAGRSCRAGRTGSPGTARRCSCRTARGRPATAPAASSWRCRTGALVSSG